MKKLALIAGIAIIIAIASAALMPFMAARRAIVPPAGVTGLETFLQWRPETTGFYPLRAADGAEHLMATGASRPFASGPSAYIFDRSGRLADWSNDIGDDPAFDRTWDAQRSRNPETIMPEPEARAWIDAGP